MFGSITYGEDHLATIEDDETLRVEFDAADTWQCQTCGEDFPEESDAEGEECSKRAECVVHTGEENCDDHDCSFPHDVVKHIVPFGWVNDVRVVIDEARDQIELGISIGDERGAFVMRLYRNDAGAIRMEVPYPGKSSLHMPLRKLNEGFYGVNEVAG
jgi:hypothetical protein